jgi:dihydrofolate synthase / folylpolyglutamate synthase
MNFDQALAYLLSLGHETLTIKLGLENTETLLAALGNPQRKFRAVQIAGTNGKGSTAAFLDSICRAAGIRTGLFTSPHLISITERIKVGGEPISEIDFARLTGTVKTVAEQLVTRGDLQTLPTFFEQVTAIALVAFATAQTELVILETGLGGRLDSTTAARAEIVAITPIAMDHEEYLGNTLPEIAAEKAAIIRPGVTAIIAPQEPSAFDVIARRCESAGVRPFFVGNNEGTADGLRSEIKGVTADGRHIVSFHSRAAIYPNATLALRGRHQVTNAATAVAIAEALVDNGVKISIESIVRGIETAIHPGRLEVWDGPPRFLFDGAHNPAAALTLRWYLDEFVAEPLVIVFAAMRDKALNQILTSLLPKADKVILTTIDNPRAASIDELSAALPDEVSPSAIVRASHVTEALELASNITPPDGIVLVTGSLHLIGAVQELLGSR